MNFIVRVSRIRKLRKHLERYPNGRLIDRLADMYDEPLTDLGWVESVAHNAPVNKNGEEIPWFSYSSIRFLEPRLKQDFSVFEYGSGNSTIWFSRRSKRVVSVEHDKIWYDQIESKMGQVSNVEYHFRDLDSGSYQNEILNYPKQFDVVILDGRERVACCKNAVQSLTDRGVIVWDNSDRDRYIEGYDFLKENNFKRIDFWGIGPSSHHFFCTSIFYRSGNCLGI